MTFIQLQPNRKTAVNNQDKRYGNAQILKQLKSIQSQALAETINQQFIPALVILLLLKSFSRQQKNN